MRLIPTLALSAMTATASITCFTGRAQAQAPPVSPTVPAASQAKTTHTVPAASQAKTTPAPVDPHMKDQVVTLPAAVTPGETVTLKWYFTGDAVTLSGGRFGKGVTVTGRQVITDKPTVNTHYCFDVTYKGDAPVGTTGQREMKTLHAHYTADVDVFHMPLTKPYSAALGWRVSYQNNWQSVNVPTPEIKRDGLVFFQPEDDSIERLAVAVLPEAKDMTVDHLMQSVEKDMPSHYEQVRILSRDSIICCHQPAVLTRFTGMDLSHPGTRTESVVLAFLNGGRAYVISGRTVAAQYRARGPILERLVRSFTISNQTLTARE